MTTSSKTNKPTQKEKKIDDKMKCEIGVCPFALGGENMAWGLGPEGWARVKARHEKYHK